MQVLKYTLHERGTAVLDLPRGAQILSVDDQCGALQLWMLVRSGVPKEARRILVAFTGFDDVPSTAVFIGTALSDGGNIVRHVFEVPAND